MYILILFDKLRTLENRIFKPEISSHCLMDTLILLEWNEWSILSIVLLYLLQGYPESMRLSCSFFLFSLKSFNCPLEDFFQIKRSNLTFKSSCLRNFRLSLKSYPLWVTLYILAAIILDNLLLFPRGRQDSKINRRSSD